jgi:hypothetical protein
MAAYGERIPVVEVDGQPVCHYHLDVAALHRALSAVTGSVAAS